MKRSGNYLGTKWRPYVVGTVKSVSLGNGHCFNSLEGFEDLRYVVEVQENIL